MYKLRHSRHEKRRKALRKRFVVLVALAGLTFIVWQVWIGLAQIVPAQGVKPKVDDGCITAGKPTRGSQSEVCPERDKPR